MSTSSNNEVTTKCSDKNAELEKAIKQFFEIQKMELKKALGVFFTNQNIALHNTFSKFFENGSTEYVLVPVSNNTQCANQNAHSDATLLNRPLGGGFQTSPTTFSAGSKNTQEFDKTKSFEQNLSNIFGCGGSSFGSQDLVNRPFGAPLSFGTHPSSRFGGSSPFDYGLATPVKSNKRKAAEEIPSTTRKTRQTKK